ncbi:hypothetical protein F5887DRAFT_13473 [Amanita rubescens]|nr:hypothetical protein F5887DRAFT_13473 [Amanita rubescens]
MELGYYQELRRRIQYNSERNVVDTYRHLYPALGSRLHQNRDALYAYSFNPFSSQTTSPPPSSSPALSQSTTPTPISPSSLPISPYLPLQQEQSLEPFQRQQYPVYSPTLVPAPSLPLTREYAQESLDQAQQHGRRYPVCGCRSFGTSMLLFAVNHASRVT